MKKILLGIGLALLTYQCDKEDEKDDTSTADKASNVADCAPALTKFAPIQTAIDRQGGSCADASCHISGTTGNTDLYFFKNNASKNRKILAGYHDGFWKEAGNLYKKIGPGYATHTLKDTNSKTATGHVGGNESWFPSEQDINSWTTAEDACP